MPELLLELFSEEIPARMQARAAEDLQRLFADKIKAQGLAATGLRVFATPRRLCLVADGLPARTPDLEEERRGPRVGAPDAAIQGFLRANGLGSLDEATRRKSDKGEFWFAIARRKGAAAAELLPRLIEGLVAELPWPKSMRFGTRELRWVRPLHGVLAVFDGKPLAGAVELGGGEGLPFTDITHGHRFMGPAPIKVTDFVDYAEKLRAARVLLDPEERRQAIREGAAALAKRAGFALVRDEALIEEVAGLVEWPVPLLGAIDPAFMDLPPEVLTVAMRTHQRYFALRRPNGALAPHFILVANIAAKDDGKAIVAGNERVLKARLSDAKFFWEQDRKIALADRVPKLKDIVFHAKLGTVADKVARIQALAAYLTPNVPGATRESVTRAAFLAKADLVTGLVGEFPELQGVMGRYYAEHADEAPEVAAAIGEHYSPLGPSDKCPSAPTSVAVALADKLDTLAGFFKIDEMPTGSKDPFALRRAAQGVIRLVLERGLRMELRNVFEHAVKLHRAAFASPTPGMPLVTYNLLTFVADRMKVHLREKGVRHDAISAVFEMADGANRDDDLVRLVARAEALQRFLKSDDGANLLVAYRRAANILKIEEKRDNASYRDEVPVEGLLRQPEEQILARALESAESVAASALKSEHFDAAMAALAKLRPQVDAFFDKVTVNCEEPELRKNRLRLLAQIRATLHTVADFAVIEG
jgi:glycyl-tRNA synthetase beta chain